MSKKQAAAIVGALLAILTAVKVYLDTPDAAPAPAHTSADAGV